MQAVEISQELEYVINVLEKLLNGKDDEFILEVLKKYKQDKSLDTYTLLELRHRLNSI